MMRPFFIACALALALTLLAGANAQPAAPKRIGSFITRAHQLSGEVFAIDDRTFEIRNLIYDGEGPAAYFWAGTGAVSSAGMRVPLVPGCGLSKLPQYNRETVRVELPMDKTIKDIGYLAVWCELADANFGEVLIGDAERAGVPSSTSPPVCSKKGTFPVQNGWNCETLRQGFQVRWKIRGPNMDVELVGKVEKNYYMGFGVSGKADKTYMVGSDVVIANEGVEDQIMAVDYLMNDRGQCAAGKGVCPDTKIDGGGRNDITKVSGKRTDDTLMVRYTRPVAASDALDLPIKVETGEQTFVSWATGPFNVESKLPQIHRGEMSTPTGDVAFEFGREPINNCATSIVAEKVVKKEVILGWTRPSFQGVTDFTARIGPSGGAQGVQGITKQDSWGIAWWVSETGSTGKEVLIPAIAVERGKTYKFRVFGGDDKTKGAMHHPMYITSDKDGGLQTKSPEARIIETVYAGVTNYTRPTNDTITAFDPTAQGPLCEFKNTPGTIPNNIKTFEEYSKTVNRECISKVDRSKAGILEWTVPTDFKPTIAYYQCLTHRDLGYKLVVFDEGKVDPIRLRAESGGGKDTCQVTFQEKTETFGGCADVNDDLRVLWNLRETSIETLFMAKKAAWAGISWGNKEMVPAASVIAYKESRDTATISDYTMRSRSPSGVQPGTQQNLTNIAAEVRDGMILGRFTRPLSASGIKSVVRGEVDFIWAMGPSEPVPQSGTNLMQHASRGSSRINLLSGKATAVADKRRPLFLAHGILMSIAWILLVPGAVLWMRFFKQYNPVTFQVHRGLNSLAVLACLVAFIMAVVRGNHTDIPHLSIGVVVTILALWQAVNGALRPHKGTNTRNLWFLAHAYSGRIALLLAIINVFLGINLYKGIFAENVLVWNIVVGIAVGLFVVATLGLSLVPGRFPVTEQEEATAAQETNVASKLEE